MKLVDISTHRQPWYTWMMALAGGGTGVDLGVVDLDPLVFLRGGARFNLVNGLDLKFHLCDVFCSIREDKVIYVSESNTTDSDSIYEFTIQHADEVDQQTHTINLRRIHIFMIFLPC